MQKRRERIERWRAERKKKEVEAVKKDLKSSLGLLFILILSAEVLKK